MQDALPRPDGQGLYPLASEADTKALAQRLSRAARAGDVIALYGDLGAGKTLFARAFINALPARGGEPLEEEVPSPTFTLVQTYERQPCEVWHVDLYRLEDPEEAWELGLEEAFAEALCLIEWPERLGPLLPARALRVRLFQEGGERRVRFEAEADWRSRLEALGLRAAE